MKKITYLRRKMEFYYFTAKRKFNTYRNHQKLIQIFTTEALRAMSKVENQNNTARKK